MMTSRQKALNDLFFAFQDFEKWKTYSIAFKLMDERKVRLIDIKDVAAQVGIDSGVIAMRRRDYVKSK